MKHPIQPLAPDAHGVMRFKSNAIVTHLLDTHPTCDLNTLATMDFSDDDRQQFAQLIGYSLGGYGELRRYVSDEAYAAAAHMADGLDEREARIAALEQKLADAVDARRGLNRPPTPVGWSDTDWLKHLEEIRQNEAAYARGPLPERGWD